MARLLLPFALLVPAVLVCGVQAAGAQAHPGCPLHPVSVAAMRGCYRPLVVLAPSPHDPRLKQQQASLDAAADDLMDRNVVYLPVFADPGGFSAPLDAPFAVLPAPEQAALRARFKTAPGAFQAVLLGEDGGVKLRSRTPVAIEQLNSLIDSMPTRRREMLRPHSN